MLCSQCMPDVENAGVPMRDRDVKHPSNHAFRETAMNRPNPVLERGYERLFFGDELVAIDWAYDCQSNFDRCLLVWHHPGLFPWIFRSLIVPLVTQAAAADRHREQRNESSRHSI